MNLKSISTRNWIIIGVLVVAVVALAIISRRQGPLRSSAGYGYGRSGARVELEARELGTKKYRGDEIIVRSGAAAELKWTSKGADSCSSSGWTTSTATKGTATTERLADTQAFDITCFKDGVDVAWDRIVVRVLGDFGY